MKRIQCEQVNRSLRPKYKDIYKAFIKQVEFLKVIGWGNDL